MSPYTTLTFAEMDFDILFAVKDNETNKPFSGEGIFEWHAKYMTKEVQVSSGAVKKRFYSTPLNTFNC